eukprot:TRINITY_DN5888_c0_g1_i1.p1 TRINITY_DN5888_c0_g1~~TRINITY_DN5888_c0_g1_i1.p1  ORF type:complete len:535 (+),score=86.94 TRINITY_DN5888_c0_g1_i1:400-2004(+)
MQSSWLDVQLSNNLRAKPLQSFVDDFYDHDHALQGQGLWLSKRTMSNDHSFDRLIMEQGDCLKIEEVPEGQIWHFVARCGVNKDDLKKNLTIPTARYQLTPAQVIDFCYFGRNRIFAVMTTASDKSDALSVSTAPRSASLCPVAYVNEAPQMMQSKAIAALEDDMNGDHPGPNDLSLTLITAPVACALGCVEDWFLAQFFRDTRWTSLPPGQKDIPAILHHLKLDCLRLDKHCDRDTVLDTLQLNDSFRVYIKQIYADDNIPDFARFLHHVLLEWSRLLMRKTLQLKDDAIRCTALLGDNIGDDLSCKHNHWQGREIDVFKQRPIRDSKCPEQSMDRLSYLLRAEWQLPAPLKAHSRFYHGTTITSATDIVEHGVDSGCFSQQSDFGEGHYITPLLSDAIRSAILGAVKEDIAIVVYDIPDDKLQGLEHYYPTGDDLSSIVIRNRRRDRKAATKQVRGQFEASQVVVGPIVSNRAQVNLGGNPVFDNTCRQLCFRQTHEDDDASLDLLNSSLVAVARTAFSLDMLLYSSQLAIE